MSKFKILTIMASITLLIAACGGGSSSGGTDTPTVNEGENAAVTVTMQADYGSDAVAERSSVPSLMTACMGTVTDSPGYVAGTDCDSDGGVVAYLDPSGFKVAIKRLSLIKDDDTYVDLIADTGRLVDSVVVDLSSPVQLDVSELPQGVYTSYYAEFYYYDLTMDIYGEEEELRIFVSDDDFLSEGNVGNHQGDVKLLDSSDNFGFVRAGAMWIDGLLDYVRPAEIGGAAGADPETNHDRGLYGDNGLWNSTAFMQGTDQDIFVATQTGGFTITSDGGEVTITFDLDDTWFFEDFDNDGEFEPCNDDTGDEACSDGAEWTPVFPGVAVSFD